MSQEDPRHTPQTNEPNFVPSQAEGDTQPEPLTEHLRTPGQAEGEREAIDETLAHHSVERRSDPDQTQEASPVRSLWDRVKAMFGRIG